MSPHSVWTGRVRRLLGLLAAFSTIPVVLAALISAPPANALTISVPSDSPRSMDVTVALAASDPTGTVMLVVDGRVVRLAGASSGETLTLSGVQLAPGLHQVRATLRSPWGTVRSDTQVTAMVWGIPGAPKMLSPSNGYAGRYADVRLRAGSSTSSLTVTFNGTVIGQASCMPGSLLKFRRVSLPKGISTFRVVEQNPFGETATYTYRVRRVDWPWPTCIVIDKSQFRLYWVRNGVLVKIYRIAHGKPSTPTPCRVWKILSKERTDPHGVYGPRKLRLFKQSGSGWARTNFGIHGTNQPWVIGTMASHGCIRLLNRDILDLWPQVPYGTMVLTKP